MKKPDQIVWSNDEGYDSNKKEYPTSVGAPKFDIPDIKSLKIETYSNLTNLFEVEKNQILKQIEKFYDEYSTSSMIWNSNMNFKPIIGKTYHLYDFGKGNTLSLVSPNEWSKNKEFIGSYELQPSDKWLKVQL